MQGQRKIYAHPQQVHEAQEALRILNTTLPQKAQRAPWRFLVPALVGGVCVLLGGAAYYWMGWSFSSTHEIPIVAAPQGPYKIRPQGAQESESVQADKTIYDQLTGQSGAPEDVRLREVPQDPVEAPPALPEDFVKALAQSPVTSMDLEGAQEEASPFVEGGDLKDPFAENDDAFFQEGGHMPDQSQTSVIKAPAPHHFKPQDTTMRPLRNAPYQTSGTGVYGAAGKMMTLDLGSAPTQELAKVKWQEILRATGVLLVTYTPAYVRVDHGVGVGVRVHVRLGSLLPVKAKELSSRLGKAGMAALILPH